MNGKPGDGSTPFEHVATFVFGLIYVLPLVGMLYAHFEGSVAAKRAAVLTPLLYHAASVLSIYIYIYIYILFELFHGSATEWCTCSAMV